MIHDAVIVGAGLSGLVCARRLIDAGARAIVVEARPRVGGRLHTGRVGGAVVDLGGQWLSVDQPRLLALARALGVASSQQPRAGRVALDDGRRLGLFGQLRALVAQRRAIRRIDRLVRAIPAGAPGEAGDAAALDAIAVGPWLAGAIANPAARERIAMHAELVFAVDPAGLSLLDYLARLGATGGFAPRGPDLPGGGRDHRFVGGAQRLALALADGLGAAVRLGEPVQAIEAAGADALTVRGPAASHAARRVVLALPPTLAIRIAPDLPVPLHRLAAAIQRGAVVKCFAAYDRAFWRDAGLSGEAYRPHGTVRAVVDATPPDGAAAVLLAFVIGAAAEAWQRRDPADRRGEVLGALAELFGDAASAPRDYLEADWVADPWSAGCVASTPPGALAAGVVWRGGHGRLHLAGTEAAVHWPGYMEGAIEAGERAAAEVLAALGPGGSR
jgi:monoamine oxidase